MVPGVGTDCEAGFVGVAEGGDGCFVVYTALGNVSFLHFFVFLVWEVWEEVGEEVPSYTH